MNAPTLYAAVLKAKLQLAAIELALLTKVVMLCAITTDEGLITVRAEWQDESSEMFQSLEHHGINNPRGVRDDIVRVIDYEMSMRAEERLVQSDGETFPGSADFSKYPVQ